MFRRYMFTVVIDEEEDSVRVMPIRSKGDEWEVALRNEIKSAIVSAIQGGYIGGFDVRMVEKQFQLFPADLD